MRNRVEDLGRLVVLIENLIDNELFERTPWRPKDYREWFDSMTEDQQDEILRGLIYGLEDIKENLYDMLSIAKGTDLLNAPLD